VEISVKRMLRTRGALVAAITALAVGLALVAGRLLTTLIAVAPFEGVWFDVLTGVLPFTVGYFFALWVVAPITEQLGVGHVITRSILATGIGATLWFVVLGLTGVVTAVTSTADVLGIAASPNLIGAQLGYALQQALTGLVVLLPLGVLGGVLQWVWRSAHPAPHHIEGLIDV